MGGCYTLLLLVIIYITMHLAAYVQICFLNLLMNDFWCLPGSQYNNYSKYLNYHVFVFSRNVFVVLCSQDVEGEALKLIKLNKRVVNRASLLLQTITVSKPHPLLGQLILVFPSSSQHLINIFHREGNGFSLEILTSSTVSSPNFSVIAILLSL